MKNRFSAYGARFPRSFQPKFRRKLACKILLESGGNLTIPDEIWFAFLTPHKASLSHVGDKEKHFLERKRRMLALWHNPDQLSANTDPNCSQGDMAALALLGLLFDLNEKTVLFTQEHYRRWIDIASRYGLWRLRYHLEDAVFKTFDAERHELIANLIKKKVKADAQMIADIRSIISAAMQTSVGPVTIYNRTKNVYGVFQKMQTKGKNINDIYDIHGFRIITENEKKVYETMSILHKLWPHFTDRYKDYVKYPKENGYQSLHTVVKSLYGTPIEFQVRSKDMDIVAVSGRANHTLYKASLGNIRP